jgi:hypothetical protein
MKEYDYIFQRRLLQKRVCSLRLQQHHLHIPLLAMVSFLSSLLPVIAGWLQFKSCSKEMRMLLGLFSFYIPILALIISLTARGINTLWLNQIYILIEFVVFALVFAVWSRNEMMQKAIRLSIFGFLAIWIIAKLSFERLTPYNTFTAPLEGLLLAAMAVSTLITLLGEEEKSSY